MIKRVSDFSFVNAEEKIHTDQEENESNTRHELQSVLMIQDQLYTMSTF